MEALLQRVPDDLPEEDTVGGHKAGTQFFQGEHLLGRLPTVPPLQFALRSHECRQPAAVFPALQSRLQNVGGAENVGGIAEFIINCEKRFRRERQGVSLSVKFKINMFHVSSQSAFTQNLGQFRVHCIVDFLFGLFCGIFHEVGRADTRRAVFQNKGNFRISTLIATI